MGVKVKGGMYCRRCKENVLAQKSGHGVRNTAAVGGALATAGLSLLAVKSEKWRCPNCGDPVVDARLKDQPTLADAIVARATRKKAQRAAGEQKVGWRCEKNGHLLDRKRTTCPIDGSPGVWRLP